jgi:hypothetical protein
MNRVVLHPQTETFMRALAPEPRRRLVRALEALPTGDINALEGRLSGYWRVRVGGYRIVEHQRAGQVCDGGDLRPTCQVSGCLDVESLLIQLWI